MRPKTDLMDITRAPDASDGPQYIALRDQIALNIEMGRLKPGTRLPSERQFQTGTGTARGTIREALFPAGSRRADLPARPQRMVRLSTRRHL